MSVSPPTSLSITPALKALILTWTDSVTAGATHTVYRSKGACGTFVCIATGFNNSYTDYDVQNGEVYAYYIVANLGVNSSDPTATRTLTFIGAEDQYSTSLIESRPSVSVYAGVVASGCGESERILRLKGLRALSGK